MEDLVYAPRQEELLTIEGALERYKDTIVLSDGESRMNGQLLAEEIEARLGFRVNVTGVPSMVGIFQGVDAEGLYHRTFVRVEKVYDDDGIRVPVDYNDVLIYGVDARGEALMVALGDDADQSNLVMLPFHFIRDIEVTEPLAA